MAKKDLDWHKGAFERDLCEQEKEILQKKVDLIFSILDANDNSLKAHCKGVFDKWKGIARNRNLLQNEKLIISTEMPEDILTGLYNDLLEKKQSIYSDETRGKVGVCMVGKTQPPRMTRALK